MDRPRRRLPDAASAFPLAISAEGGVKQPDRAASNAPLAAPSREVGTTPEMPVAEPEQRSHAG